MNLTVLLIGIASSLVGAALGAAIVVRLIHLWDRRANQECVLEDVRRELQAMGQLLEGLSGHEYDRAAADWAPPEGARVVFTAEGSWKVRGD